MNFLGYTLMPVYNEDNTIAYWQYEMIFTGENKDVNC